MSDNLPFIPSKLDDAGLTPAQFRIVCRVSRRGSCHESIPNLAKGCRLAITTVKAVLPFLVSINVLFKEKRPGQTSIYKVKPPGEWQMQPRPKDYPAQKAPRVAKQPVTQSTGHPNHPAQKTPHKGTPDKAIPLRGVPQSLETRDAGLLAKDRERIQKQIHEAREAAKPDGDLISGLKAELRFITDEFRRRGKLATTPTTPEADNSPHQTTNGACHPRAAETPTAPKQQPVSPEPTKKFDIWKLSPEKRAELGKPLQDFVQQTKQRQAQAP
jgi:hypothetical protein